MGAPKNPKTVALGAMLRIGDEASFKRIGYWLRQTGGQLDGPAGLCVRHGIAHRTFMRWRKNIPKLDLLVIEVRAEITAIKARVARLAESGDESDDSENSGNTEEGKDNAGGDDDAGDADDAHAAA